MFGIRNCSKLLQHWTKLNSTVTVINPHVTALFQTLPNHTVINHVKDTQTSCTSYRFFMCSAVKHTGKSSSTSNKTPNIGEYDTLSEFQAYDMIHKLSNNDRASLLKALNKYNSDKIKSKFQGNCFRLFTFTRSLGYNEAKNTVFYIFIILLLLLM